ncbi:MAG: hypothetical protein K2O45_04795 [Oscillospiraceae bacterium]|nr:hypothetical protein [Oscillospiraceae bacterium]
MLGYIIYGDGAKRPELAERQLSGGNFVTLHLGIRARANGPLALYRARQGAKMLREAGVRSAVFPVDFPYTALFIRMGILPIDTLPLRRALAAPLTRRRLESSGFQPTQAVVAISGERAVREVTECAKALALSYRYVLLSARGAENFARSLRREYGISLLLEPSPDQLNRADALVLFTPRGDLKLDNPILYTLYPGGEAGRGRLPLCLPGEAGAQVENNCDQEQLAAALYAMGALSLETLLAEIPG